MGIGMVLVDFSLDRGDRLDLVASFRQQIEIIFFQSTQSLGFSIGENFLIQ